MLTSVPLWTVLLGKIARPTVSIVYAVGPNAMQTHKHTQALERNNIDRPVCLVYVKLSLGTEPITRHSKSIIFPTREVKSEGRRSLATCLLQSKQELLEEGKTFNKQHLTLCASCGRAVLIYPSSRFSSATAEQCSLLQHNHCVHILKTPHQSGAQWGRVTEGVCDKLLQQ